MRKNAKINKYKVAIIKDTIYTYSNIFGPPKEVDFFSCLWSFLLAKWEVFYNTSFFFLFFFFYQSSNHWHGIARYATTKATKTIGDKSVNFNHFILIFSNEHIAKPDWLHFGYCPWTTILSSYFSSLCSQLHMTTQLLRLEKSW